jgi:hypothetical protein
MNFFVLAKPKTGSPEDIRGGIDIIQAEGTQTGDFLKCPQCNFPLTMREWLAPHRVDLEPWGKAYGDIDVVGDGLVVFERFKDVFVENGLSGLSNFQPVEVAKVKFRRGRINNQPPVYFKATITRSPTAVDQKASGYAWRHPSRCCPSCVFGGDGDLKRCERIVIDERTWNGDDIFWPHGGTRIMVSERFKSVCERYEILGVVFNDPEDEHYDYYPWESQAE